MSPDFNSSRISAFSYNQAPRDSSKRHWLRAAHAGLFLNVLGLLCSWSLIQRTHLAASNSTHDLLAVVAIVCFTNRNDLIATADRLASNLSANGNIYMTFAAGTIAFAILVVLSYLKISQDVPSSSSHFLESLTSKQLQPRIFPCRTTHTRLFPKRHSFSYSYLYAGIPVGWEGAMNTFLSADTAASHSRTGNGNFRKTWFSVEGSDHLQRTSSVTTNLLGRLQDYLVSQGIAPQQYPYVYLVTAPRVLGFSFNPVSFWYLYSGEKRLTAMILEVNNTFDERRLYFMERANQQDGIMDRGNDVFLQSWKKDFHVSPFNGRDGSYSLKASDPFAPNLSGGGRIDNTITLSSSDGMPKIVARVFSAEPPVLASHVNRIQALRFVSKWWWVGFMTNVRIIREARKLWSKNLQVFYRPEVIYTNIARQATAEEDILADNFLKFIRYVQGHLPGQTSVRYTAAAGKSRATPIMVGGHHAQADDSQESGLIFNLCILTPAFYSNFCQYSDVGEAFTTLCICKAESERMAVLSDAHVFLQQIAAVSSIKTQSLQLKVLRDCAVLEAARRSPIWSGLWLLLSGKFLKLGSLDSFRPSQLSLIDLAVFSSEAGNNEDHWQYLQAAIRVLFAHKLALGSTFLLQCYVNLFRCILLWFVSARLQKLILALQRIFMI